MGAHSSKTNSKGRQDFYNNINNNFYRHLSSVLMSFAAMSKTPMGRKKRSWTLKQVKHIRFRNHHSCFRFQRRSHHGSRFTGNHGQLHFFRNSPQSHRNQLQKAGNYCRRSRRLSVLVGLACSISENVRA